MNGKKNILNGQFEHVIPTLRTPGESLHLVVQQGILYHQLKTPAKPFIMRGESYPLDEPGVRVKQLAFPVEALPWVVDAIQHYLKTHAAVNARATINHEVLCISSIDNLQDNLLNGIAIKNCSRASRYREWQEMSFPRATIRQTNLIESWYDIVRNHKI